MVDPRYLKKLKILILENGLPVSPERLEKLASKTANTSEKNFLTGLKHITEKHYAEAIKWLQLSECRDSPLIIALLAFKLADEFLFDEYINEKFSEDCLRKLGFKIRIEVEGERLDLSHENLKTLKEKL